MSKRCRVLLAVIIPCALLFSGCSSSNQTTPAGNTIFNKPGQSGAKVTLTLWSRTDTPLFENVIKGFAEEMPDIQIKLMKPPEAGDEKALDLSTIASGDMPDLFAGPTKETINQLVELDQVHSLDDIFPKALYNQFSPGTFAEGLTMVGGSVYQFPLISSLQGGLMMYYNRNVLDKLGIKESEIPKTWDDLLRVGQEIVQKSNGEIHALHFDGKASGIDLDVIEQSASAISPGYGLRGFNFSKGEYDYDLPGVQETFGFFKKAYDEKVLDPATLDAKSGASLSLFKAGKVAFIFQGFGGGSTLRGAGWGVAPIPTQDGKPSYKYIQGGSPEGLYVNKNTKHWTEVKTFLEYMSEYYYRDMIYGGSELPAMKLDAIEINFPYPQYETMAKLVTQSGMLAPNVYKRNSDMVDVMAKYNQYKPSDSIGNVFIRFLSGQLGDPSQALQKLSEDNNKALERAVMESGGKVNKDDFIFSDWVPGKPFEEG